MDVAAELVFVCARPFLLFLAVEEGHECGCDSDGVLGAYVVGLAEVDFDEGGFVSGFGGQFVVGGIYNFAWRTGRRGEEDDGARFLGAR